MRSSIVAELPEAIRELDRELAELHSRHPTAEMTESAQNMVRQLHIAVHGGTWAQPESAREVWDRLLAEVIALRASQ